ncbi:hypothetical protein [Phaeobacter italicus]|jgi:hypothetical protein|uniref:hypothetical protein n=1 Tax=Phaeobacter italicus TaxID=481446 RepID=UPI002FDD585E
MTDTSKEKVERFRPAKTDMAHYETDADMKNDPDGSWVRYEDYDALRAKLQSARDEAQHGDDIAVDQFAAAMKAKLKDARENKGRSGWDDPKRCSDMFLASALLRHAYKHNAGTFEDIANFAMMLHQRGVSPAIMKEANAAFDAEFRDEALEEAAQAVESVRHIEKDHWSPEYRQGGQAMNIGACGVIRALKSTSNEGEG